MATVLNEAVAGQQALIDRLAADATLSSYVNGVYAGHLGPERTPYPVVRVTLIDSDDLGTMNLTRIWANLIFEVVAVDSGADPSADLQAAANRIDVLLHRTAWTSADGLVSVDESFRERPVVRPDFGAGDAYQWAGGEYHLRVRGL